MKKIAIASDHAGFTLKESLKQLLIDAGYQVDDCGCDSPERVDYPDYAAKAALKVQNQDVQQAVLVCGTGIGMSLSANKLKGIRAAVVSDIYSAEMTRLHNDANVICLGSRVVGEGVAEKIVKVFLTTEFEGGRHADRVQKISDLENQN